MPSNNIDNCAGISDTAPSRADGQIDMAFWRRDTTPLGRSGMTREHLFDRD